MKHPKISGTGKKEGVRDMFNHIAKRYDFLNHFLSAGIDRVWRRKLIRELKKSQPQKMLDVATGTADLAILAARKSNAEVVGVDISEKMLEIGRQKIEKSHLQDRIQLQLGDAEKLPFGDESFDAAMVAFGVRNFEDLQAGLKEICRVLKPGASFFVLEFSKPRQFPVKQFYAFYSKYFLPFAGRLISKDNGAYTYLPESVQAFPDGDDFLNEMNKAGFQKLKAEKLSFGIASLYQGIKEGKSTR